MELKQLFDSKKVAEDIIRERKKGFVLICSNKEKILLTGKDFKLLFKLITQSKGLVTNISPSLISKLKSSKAFTLP
jgi:hypothetical protein